MTTKRRIVALLLCLAMLLAMTGPVGARSGEPEAPAQEPQDSRMYVYGKEGETTFVPDGYTYIYQNEDGEVLYTQTVSGDTYISERTLTPEEAEALNGLEYGDESYTTNPDGTVSVSREYNAAEAAAYSAAVQAILNGEEVTENETVRIRVEGYTQDQEIPVMIVFEDPSVSQMETMTVQLGQVPGTAELSAMADIQARQVSAAAAISRALGYNIQVEEQFALLTNAVSATVRYGDLDEINAMEGVKHAYVMPTFSVPEVNATDVETAVMPSMKYVGEGMGSNVAWDLGYKGEGMSVAILDTGITLTNPVFSQEPVDQTRVAFTKEDIKDVLNGNFLHVEALAEDITADDLYYSSKIPFGFDYADELANYGDDFTDLGHGSHVAGIVGGNLPEAYQSEFEMTAMGIAPEAQLIAMKVFDRYGSGPMDAVVAAMEDAILLGVDCANLSLGVDVGPCYLEGITEVFDAAYEAGINVVVSAGNSAFTGYNSLWGGSMVESSTVSTGTLGMPATFDSVLTVASAENGGLFNTTAGGLCWYNAYGGIDSIDYEQADNVPADKTMKSVLDGKAYPWTTSFEDAQGKLVFCGIEKDASADPIIEQASEAGAVGVILYNANPSGLIDEYVKIVTFTVTNFDVPAIAIITSDYRMLVNSSAADTLFIPTRWEDNPAAGEMSDFSSWGPTESLLLKPEITGIGGNVFSAYGDGFAVASGTSMASPAVAATAALLRQYLQTTDIAPEDYAHVVNCLLMSTATPIFDKEHGTYYFVRRQGAGMANAGAAVNSGAYIQVEGTSKAKLELGDDPERTGVYEMTFEVVNFSDVDKTYTLDTSVLGQVAEGGQIKNGQVTYLVYDYAKNLNPEIVYSAADGKLTVPAGGTAEVTVTVTLSDDDRSYMDERFPYGSYVEGFVRLLSEDAVPLSVPFLAFYGSFGEAPIFEEGTYDNLLAGKYAYNTADHAHNVLLSYIPDSLEQDFPGFFDEDYVVTRKDWYLGNTLYKQMTKLPEALMEEIYALDGNIMPFYSQHAGVSPNGDGVMDFVRVILGLKRNAKELRCTVTNKETGEVIWEQVVNDMYKTYYSDNYGQAMACTALSMEWLYPIIWETDGAYYDVTQCLLDENTWVTIKVEAVSEYGTGTDSVHDTVEFSLYIDTTPTVASLSDIRISAYEEYWEDEDYGMTILSFESNYTEQWFVDYAVYGFTWFDEETQSWAGSVLSSYACSPTPVDQRTPTHRYNLEFLDSSAKSFHLVYDYAGNAFAHQIEHNKLLDLVELSAEKTTMYVGESITIRNVADSGYTTGLTWQSSDSSIASIGYFGSSGANEITVSGVAPGTVTISGGFGFMGKYMEGIEITVLAEGTCLHPETEIRNAKEPTCSAEGYTGDTHCKSCGELLASGESVPMLEHTYEAVVTAPTCTDKGFTTYTCAVCGDSYVDDHVDALGHSLTSAVTEPTCTAEGYTQHTCAVCGITYRDTVVPALGHDWSDWATVTEPTHDDAGEQARVCGACGETQTEVLLPTGHDFTATEVEPTCTEAGYTLHTCECGKTYMTNIVEALGHEHEAVVTAPTCTEWGYTTYTCHCGDSYVSEPAAPTGHSFGEWTVTVEPDCFTEGEEVRTCADCGEIETRVIEASDEHCPSKEFTDLDNTEWYHEGVDYVLEKGLMKGMSDTEFQPKGNLTRAQLVTTLYRMAGEPNVEGMENPFTDVAEDAWFAEAVIWAYDAKIVNGTSDTTFAPNAAITREQIAAILYRYSGAEPVEEDYLKDFTDANEVTLYAKDALNWAVANGLITGMGNGKVAPTGTATRAQIATILMRFLG